ncbi:MAG: HAMP domain-containing sensor histidine kinase [Bacteroidia bacterium]
MRTQTTDKIYQPESDEFAHKSRRLLYLSLVTGSIVSAVYCLVDLLSGYHWSSALDLFILLSFALAARLSKFESTLLASKIFIFLALNFVLAIQTFLFEPFNYQALLFIPILIFIPVVFRQDQSVYSISIGVITIIAMLISTFCDFRFDIAYQLDRADIKIQWIINYAGAITISVLGMYYVVKVNDSMHLKLLEQKNIVRDNNDTLQETIKTRDKLFSLIAHDLKGPFQSMAASLEILNAKDTSQEDKQMVIDHLSKRAENTIIMLNNLLLWSQTQIDAIRFKPEIIAVDRLIENLAVNFKMQAENKAVRINIDKPGELVVYADKVMLESILRNLISNAIKFTPTGGLVSLKVDNAGDKILFQVLDTGVGMDETVLEMLRNKQSYSSNGTNREQGHGLGLLLVQEFLKIHETTLSIESEEGKGSEFSFLLRKA